MKLFFYEKHNIKKIPKLKQNIIFKFPFQFDYLLTSSTFDSREAALFNMTQHINYFLRKFYVVFEVQTTKLEYLIIQKCNLIFYYIQSILLLQYFVNEEYNHSWCSRLRPLSGIHFLIK